MHHLGTTERQAAPNISRPQITLITLTVPGIFPEVQRRASNGFRRFERTPFRNITDKIGIVSLSETRSNSSQLFIH